MGDLPHDLGKALAIGWSLAVLNTPDTLILHGAPRILGRILRGPDWLLALPKGVTLTSFETISRDPLCCNHGMMLSRPKGAAHRLFAREIGHTRVRPKTPPKLPKPPCGHVVIGLSMAPRASALGHPFAEHLPPEWRAMRQAAQVAILGGQNLPPALPRNLLRCLLRDLAASAPIAVRDLARSHDRPLYRVLSG